jgi:hypothetical protein
MMMQIAIEKFDKKYFESIKNILTDDIILTCDGKPVARVIPFKEKDDSQKQLFGFLKGMVQIQGDIIEPVGEKWEADES